MNTINVLASQSDKISDAIQRFRVFSKITFDAVQMYDILTTFHHWGNDDHVSSFTVQGVLKWPLKKLLEN